MGFALEMRGEDESLPWLQRGWETLGFGVDAADLLRGAARLFLYLQTDVHEGTIDRKAALVTPPQALSVFIVSLWSK